MSLVLVNGNPESGAIWDLLVPELQRDDVIRLSPPGFGAKVPPGFGCTTPEYTRWLTGELEHIGHPVDLVGHDLGGIFTLGVAMTRPDLLRTWASDTLGILDPDYAWHDLAITWQAPGTGEKSVNELFGAPVEQRAERLVARGIPRAIADKIALEQGAEMGRAILAFYRSSAQPKMAELGRDLDQARARPGLAIIGTADKLVGSVELRQRSAVRAGARTAILDGIGHWWMVQAYERSAEALKAFWRDA